MRVFWASAKKPDLDCWACWSSVTAKNIFVSVTHRGILFWFCNYGIRRGERIFLWMSYRSNRQSGDWSGNLALMGSLIGGDNLVSKWWARLDIHINANSRNAYRSKIIDRQCGNWSGDSQVVMGSLTDGGDYMITWTELTPAPETLTRGRSLISKAEIEVETSRLWAVCSITLTQYLKMRWAKLNTHTDASSNLCACSRITSRNEWQEISGACYECRRSCWPRPMYRTQRWFLGLEKFLIKALHIVDDEGQRERTID